RAKYANRKRSFFLAGIGLAPSSPTMDWFIRIRKGTGTIRSRRTANLSFCESSRSKCSQTPSFLVLNRVEKVDFEKCLNQSWIAGGRQRTSRCTSSGKRHANHSEAKRKEITSRRL